MDLEAQVCGGGRARGRAEAQVEGCVFVFVWWGGEEGWGAAGGAGGGVQVYVGEVGPEGVPVLGWVPGWVDGL